MRYSLPIVVVAALLLPVAVFALSLRTDAPEYDAHLPAELEQDSSLAKATFAGGCFWCIEARFEKLPGVRAAVSGYAGGRTASPTYEQVSTGRTGHVEAVQVYYDPKQVTYRRLLEVFWRSIDPTDAGGQFSDRGSQYGTAIFVRNENERREAEASKKQLGENGPFRKAIVTPIKPFTNFYPAEEYHQDYYKKEPSNYEQYAEGSGRRPYVCRIWNVSDPDADLKPTVASQLSSWRTFKRPSDKELKKSLSTMQYYVARKNGTEPPFVNAYWNNKEDGIYVDLVSGEPLFSSKDMFDSGTGWPSFTRPLDKKNIVEKADNSFFMKRTEVRSRLGDSHLGHLFDDGPAPTGLRYCMNSAAIRFIPADRLAAEGYGEYASLFKKATG